MPRDDIRAVVQWLINNHYMLKTKSKYPVLHPTYDVNHFDDCITIKQLKNFKKYLENPEREIFEDDSSEEDINVGNAPEITNKRGPKYETRNHQRSIKIPRRP